ncbi:MAG TPA: hypothetical protein VN408_34825 [Actinoplanes sp.]|nr:hypothetical protein [Actinoplanes sp.]
MHECSGEPEVPEHAVVVTYALSGERFGTDQERAAVAAAGRRVEL